MSSVIIIAGVVTNILSVVGIVITNKYITEVDRFHYMVFLSFLHFLFTSIGTRVLLAMGVFSYKPAPLSGILPVAAGSLLSVGFMNLNLSYNSVGFYQVNFSWLFLSLLTYHDYTLLFCATLYIYIYTLLLLSPIAVKTGVYSLHSVRTICGLQAVCSEARAANVGTHHLWCWLCDGV